MITKVQRWGNSQGLRLSREILASAQIEVGDEVEVAVSGGQIVLTPARRVRGGHDLSQLVREIPADYGPAEEGWGPPSGKEVW
jgi:antitoxin MazE